jgi:hypothetical protein
MSLLFYTNMRCTVYEKLIALQASLHFVGRDDGGKSCFQPGATICEWVEEK